LPASRTPRREGANEVQKPGCYILNHDATHCTV